MLRVYGTSAEKAFSTEAGGHRWQRTPPTEKRGRVHTSTVTVAVLPVPKENKTNIDPKDLEITITRGHGAGGQHKNVTDSAVRIVHKPTGETAWCQSERSQHRNKATAMEILLSRLSQRAAKGSRIDRNEKRRSQVGSGMRGDKIRTVALQRDQVTDHQSGKRISAKKYLQIGPDFLT